MLHGVDLGLEPQDDVLLDGVAALDIALDELPVLQHPLLDDGLVELLVPRGLLLDLLDNSLMLHSFQVQLVLQQNDPLLQLLHDELSRHVLDLDQPAGPVAGQAGVA